MNLVRQNDIRAEHIASVAVGMPTNTMKVVDSRAMHNICLQDMLAAAILTGGLKLRETPFPEVLNHPQFAQLRPKVSLAGHPDLDRDQPNGRGSIVTITTTDGKSVTTRVDHPRGHSLRGGVTWDDLAAKWRDGLPECDVDKMVALAQRLDEIEDVNEFLDAFKARG